MPALSADGSKIVAVHDNDLQQFSMQILSAETGEILSTLPNPDNYFFTYPQWLPDGHSVVSSARLPDGRMTLISCDIEDGSIQEYFPPSYAPIGRPCVYGEWVYFTMTQGDVDQIFRLHRSTRYLQQVTLDATSKYQPTIDPVSGELCYAEYTLSGKKLMRMQPDSAETRLVKKTGSVPDPFIEPDEQNILSEWNNCL